MVQLKALQTHLMSFACNNNGTANLNAQDTALEQDLQTTDKPKEQEQMAYFRFEKPKDKRSLPRT
jgi:hypothetical protein